MARSKGGGNPPPERRIMVYDPRIHHRRSIRLRGYDDAGGGAYFITICTLGKIPQFGSIVEGEMALNESGRLVQKTWDDLPQRFHTLILDSFQVMPNHVHGVFVLPGPGLHPVLAEVTGAPIIEPGAINQPWDGRSNLVAESATFQGRASPSPTSGWPARPSVGRATPPLTIGCGPVGCGKGRWLKRPWRGGQAHPLRSDAGQWAAGKAAG
jgi:hypothetical protein